MASQARLLHGRNTYDCMSDEWNMTWSLETCLSFSFSVRTVLYFSGSSKSFNMATCGDFVSCYLGAECLDCKGGALYVSFSGKSSTCIFVLSWVWLRRILFAAEETVSKMGFSLVMNDFNSCGRIWIRRLFFFFKTKLVITFCCLFWSFRVVISSSAENTSVILLLQFKNLFATRFMDSTRWVPDILKDTVSQYARIHFALMSKSVYFLRYSNAFSCLLWYSAHFLIQMIRDANLHFFHAICCRVFQLFRLLWIFRYTFGFFRNLQWIRP